MFLFVQYSALQDLAQHCGTVVQTADTTYGLCESKGLAEVKPRSLPKCPLGRSSPATRSLRSTAPASALKKPTNSHSSFTSVLSGFHRPALLLFQAGELSIM